MTAGNGSSAGSPLTSGADFSVCTYITETVDVQGSAKGADGWFAVSTASVYLDHPVHAPAEHTLNIDFLAPALGAAHRVAVELDPAAARQLAEAILRTVSA